jgi:hypothetical protein
MQGGRERGLQEPAAWRLIARPVVLPDTLVLPLPACASLARFCTLHPPMLLLPPLENGLVALPIRPGKGQAFCRKSDARNGGGTLSFLIVLEAAPQPRT